MQINKINMFTFPQKAQPAFKGIWFDESDEGIISSSFRDDELYDPKRDFQDDMYRIYDYNDLPLYAPKRAFPVPQIYRDTYEMKDSRRPEIDSDTYHNDYAPLCVLGDTYGVRADNDLSIKDIFILRKLASTETKDGKSLLDERFYKSLKSFALKHSSGNQKLAKVVADVCKIEDSYKYPHFSKSIFNIINRNCENLHNSKILSKIDEVEDLIDVAIFRESNGNLYWNTIILNKLDSMGKVADGFSLDKQKMLIQACIVKDRLNNDRFLADAADFCLKKFEDCSPYQYDALLSAVRTGVQYDKSVQDYVFNKNDALKHYDDAIAAIFWNNQKTFEWNFPSNYENYDENNL